MEGGSGLSWPKELISQTLAAALEQHTFHYPEISIILKNTG